MWHGLKKAAKKKSHNKNSFVDGNIVWRQPFQIEGNYRNPTPRNKFDWNYLRLKRNKFAIQLIHHQRKKKKQMKEDEEKLRINKRIEEEKRNRTEKVPRLQQMKYIFHCFEPFRPFSVFGFNNLFENSNRTINECVLQMTWEWNLPLDQFRGSPQNRHVGKVVGSFEEYLKHLIYPKVYLPPTPVHPIAIILSLFL